MAIVSPWVEPIVTKQEQTFLFYTYFFRVLIEVKSY